MLLSPNSLCDRVLLFESLVKPVQLSVREILSIAHISVKYINYSSFFGKKQQILNKINCTYKSNLYFRPAGKIDKPMDMHV